MNGGPCDIRVLGTAELHTVRKRRERFHVFRLVPADEPFGPSPSSPERSQPECSAEGARHQPRRQLASGRGREGSVAGARHPMRLHCPVQLTQWRAVPYEPRKVKLLAPMCPHPPSASIARSGAAQPCHCQPASTPPCASQPKKAPGPFHVSSFVRGPRPLRANPRLCGGCVGVRRDH